MLEATYSQQEKRRFCTNGVNTHCLHNAGFLCLEEPKQVTLTVTVTVGKRQGDRMREYAVTDLSHRKLYKSTWMISTAGCKARGRRLLPKRE